jgi:hypothetical protein
MDFPTRLRCQEVVWIDRAQLEGELGIVLKTVGSYSTWLYILPRDCRVAM